MGLFKRFFRGKGEEIDTHLDSDDQKITSRDELDFEDSYQRNKYVYECLEQIAQATKETKKLSEEYESVNVHLKDMELIDAFSQKDRTILQSHAKALIRFRIEEKKKHHTNKRMSDTNFYKIEKIQDEVEEIYNKIFEAQEYQKLVKHDLSRLESEKQACIFRYEEAQLAIRNMRGMAIICSSAIIVSIFLLVFLQMVLEFEVLAGYLLTGVVGSITLTVLFVKYLEAITEAKQSAKSKNKVITLQNKVKIRYVNQSNLLDYLYTKYEVNSAEELKKMHEQYEHEREERKRVRELELELDFHGEQILKMLRQFKIVQLSFWIQQPEALVDPKEMVEVRHAFILKRQKLRKQLEYNEELAMVAQREIRDLVGDYPKYAQEILKKVSDYEEKFG